MTRPVRGTSSRARQFAALIQRLQSENQGQPVILSPADVTRLSGIAEADQIRIRQRLMRAGWLRLSVVDGRWAYALAESRYE